MTPDNLSTNKPTMTPRIQATVKLDPVVVHQLKIAAAYAKSTVKALVEDAIRIAGKTDRRFRFEEPRGKR